jgi:hypothetical protein
MRHSGLRRRAGNVLKNVPHFLKERLPIALPLDTFLKLGGEADTDGTLEHLQSLVGLASFCATRGNSECDLRSDDPEWAMPAQSETKQNVQGTTALVRRIPAAS